MRKSALAVLLVSAFLALITASAAVYADSESLSGLMMGGGMMGRSMVEHGAMMSRMSRMMSGCSAMMQGGTRNDRPNERWRDERSIPDRDR